jgi:hypothetical protein
MGEDVIRAYSFHKAGPGNTEKTLRAAVERARELRIGHIVVASCSGRTAFQLKDLSEESDYEGQLVVITHHTGYSEPGVNQLKEEDRSRLKEAGCRVVTATHALSSISRSYRTKFGGIDLLEIVAVAGTGRGADSAIVVRPANQNRFFDLKVREIIAMPR